jgi:hypothetical protein
LEKLSKTMMKMIGIITLCAGGRLCLQLKPHPQMSNLTLRRPY